MANLRQSLAQAAQALERAGVAEARLTAEILLAHLLGRERSYLYAHPEQELDAANEARWQTWVERRAARAPLQHLTGRQEFYGRSFEVGPAALIPRPETELLLEAVLERIPAAEPWRILDAGTGSGCLAVTLALERPCARVLATDISLEALQLARRNSSRLGAYVTFAAGDWLAPFAGGWDVIVSNPPYLADTELPDLAPEVRDHEPPRALLAGPRGTEAYERLVPQARQRLRPGGWLGFELGYASAADVRPLFAAGWTEVEVRRDLQNWDRVLLARSAP